MIGLIGYQDISSINLSSYTHIHMKIRTSIAVSAGNIRFLLDNTSGCVSPLKAIDIPALEANTWTRVSLPLGTATSLTAIISLGLYAVVDKGAMTIDTKEIYAVKEYVGTADDPWSAVTLNDEFIFTNYVNVIQKYDGSTVTDLGGTPPRARAITAFRNRLVVASIMEDGEARPYRVRWSSVGTTETWDGGTSGYVDLLDTPDWCVALALLKDTCFAYKDTSIWELQYIGGQTVFSPIMRSSVNGTISPNSIQTIKDMHYFSSSDAIYTFDGFNLAMQDTKLFPLMYKTGSREKSLTYPKRVCSMYFEEIGEYWLAFPSTRVTTRPDILLKRDKEGGWVKNSAFYSTCMGLHYTPSTVTPWSSAVGTWLTQSYGTWRDTSRPGNVFTILIGWYDGQIYQDDRATFNTDIMTYETKDFLFGHAHKCVEVRLLYKKGPCTVYYSLDGGTTWVSLGTLSAQTNWTEGVKYFNQTTQRVRFRVTSTANEFQLKWIEPWYIQRARSKTLTES